PALGVEVDREATASDPLNTWLRTAYRLRNRIAHTGYRPSDEEAIEAVSLSSHLIGFAGERATTDERLGIEFPEFDELIPAPALDERSLAPTGEPSDTRLAREAFSEGISALRDEDQS